jgi:chorismate lyase
MSNMTPSKERNLDSSQWLPAQFLGQFSVDESVRPWLIGKGLLTQRMKAACGERFGLRLVEQWTGLLCAALKTALGVADGAALFRDVELCCGGHVWVFAQSVIPDSTLCVHPWLGELGDSSLGETLHELSGVERSSFEFAWLPRESELTARALREAELTPAGLWARRSRIQLRGAPLLVQELFLPAMGRV